MALFALPSCVENKKLLASLVKPCCTFWKLVFNWAAAPAAVVADVFTAGAMILFALLSCVENKQLLATASAAVVADVFTATADNVAALTA
eukprot:5108107-Ditylum_brightwellii.AAC.1